jgi:hypothetical protein
LGTDEQESNSMNHLFTTAAIAAALSAGAAFASPAVLVSAKDDAIITSGPGNGTLLETRNQAGLAANYVDEVTSLHPFTAATQHTPTFNGFEWFGNSGTDSAEVSYFVNASSKIRGIDHFVLWNEESSGIGVFNLWYGAFAGDKSDLVLTRVSPTDNPLASYGADVWEFNSRPNTGWWTIEASGCPQPNPGSFAACAVGEVAWGGPKVPEPATWAMMLAGFGLVGAAVRRRQPIAHAIA